jgi:hypothetical protein
MVRLRFAVSIIISLIAIFMHQRITGSTIVVLTLSQILFSFPFNLPDVKEAHAATVVQATSFASTTHAGTLADPWPGSAIKAAIDSLPDTGGTVMVADGIWQVDSLLRMTKSHYTLMGQSLQAKILFTGTDVALFLDGGEAQAQQISNVHLRHLTFDPSPYTITAISPVTIKNCVNCTFTDNSVIGLPNVNAATVIFHGGANVQILRNKIGVDGAHGGAQLQLNALGNDVTNTGFVVADNMFDSVNLLVIGLNDARFTRNILTNDRLRNYIGMSFAAPYLSTMRNLVVDQNIVQSNGNGAFISGLSQDPGGKGFVNGLTFDANMVIGVYAIIGVQTYLPWTLTDDQEVSDTTNVQITNNTVDAAWQPAQIDISGGTYGVVDTVWVEGNTLITHVDGAANQITSDTHTSHATVQNNLMAGVTIPVHFAASAADIFTGQSVTLTWDAPGATTCAGVNVDTGGSTSGSLTVAPPLTTPYAVVCQGSHGSGSGFAFVTVTPPNTFHLNDRVQTTAKVRVRTSPSTSASQAGIQQKGNTGTVIGGPTTANRYTWWNINFDKGADGWVQEQYLVKTVSAR